MALLKYNLYQDVESFQREFFAETGLVMQVMVHKDIAEKNMKLADVLRYRYGFPLFKLIRNSMTYGCICIPRCWDVEMFEEEVSQLLFLDVRLFDEEGARLAPSLNIHEAIASRSKKPVIDRVKLRDLNRRLRVIEKEIWEKACTLSDAADRMVRDKDDIIVDYEIEANIQYHLADDDALSVPDEDNTLVTDVYDLEVKYDRSDKRWGIHDEKDHTDRSMRLKHFVDEPHCYLFHDLYGHLHIEPEDMQRIGTIWVDIVIQYQRCYEHEA